MEKIELERVVSKFFNLASEFESIDKLWLFGSRYKNTHSENSDLDIAIALIPMPKEVNNLYGDEFNYWLSFKDKNYSKFSEICPWKLDLQWYGGAEVTNCLHGYLEECSTVIYEKS